MIIRTLVAIALGITFVLNGVYFYQAGRSDTDIDRRPDARMVRVYVLNPLNAADPRLGLPAAWEHATEGRGRLSLVARPDDADAVIMVLPGDGDNFSWRINARQRAVVISVGSATVRRLGISVVVHEIAHQWCCDIGGVADGHWLDDDEPGLMNASTHGYAQGLFSPRELRALGLTE